MKRLILTALLYSSLTSLSTGCLIVSSSDDEGPSDFDGDGVSDTRDNCPETVNPIQEDSDGNGIGDACEEAPDGDGDGILDDQDNCLTTINEDQSDQDADGSGDACDDTGAFSISWQLLKGINNDPAECPTFENYMEVVIRNTENGDERVEMFNCDAPEVLTGQYELGEYEISVSLIDAEINDYFALGNVFLVVLDQPTVVTVEVFEMSLDHGSFRLSWRILEGDAELTCADVPADTVALTSVNVTDSMSYTDAPNCDLGEYSTPALPLGTYDVSVALSSAGEPLGESLLRQETIQYGSELVDLGNFDFQLQPPAAQ